MDTPYCRPCHGKQTTTDCNTCNMQLLQHIEQREFELGVAPDDAYVKTEQFTVLYVTTNDSPKPDLGGSIT